LLLLLSEAPGRLLATIRYSTLYIWQ
jgi:hypothetical protein